MAGSGIPCIISGMGAMTLPLLMMIHQRSLSHGLATGFMSGLTGAQISYSGDPKMKWMMKKSGLIIFLGLLFFSQAAYAWKVPIEVVRQTAEGEKAFHKLVVGIESGATDGFDNLWDTPALLPQPDPETVVFHSRA